jgi:GNAT superfamily N-acetyltransferase
MCPIKSRGTCANALFPRLRSAIPFIEYLALTIHIRPANTADAALILRFITELAVYEKAEHEVVATAKDIEASLFSANSSAKSLICEMNGEPIGFCVYFFSYSTWLGKQGLYLEDLYISPTSRGSGAGKQMLRHLARIACEPAAAASSGACLTGTSRPSASMNRSARAHKANGCVIAWQGTRSRHLPKALTN